jgi:tRNA threonylcarbamoyladenosine biosynthesis protein TsaE
MHIATSSDNIDISSEKKTEEIARKIQKKIKVGDVIFLYGEMGVGKTTFIKYLINHFEKKSNIKLSEVMSPTFNLLNEYKIKDIQINHYDLYRLKEKRDLENLNLFGDSDKSITLIEWPQIIDKKPKNLIEFLFKYDDDYKKRFLQIKGLLVN